MDSHVGANFPAGMTAPAAAACATISGVVDGPSCAKALPQRKIATTINLLFMDWKTLPGFRADGWTLDCLFSPTGNTPLVPAFHPRAQTRSPYTRQKDSSDQTCCKYSPTPHPRAACSPS